MHKYANSAKNSGREVEIDSFDSRDYGEHNDIGLMVNILDENLHGNTSYDKTYTIV